VIIPSRQYALPCAVGAVAGIVGAMVAFHYHQLGLTLSHYDARGHLVVARRIIDSITPGWQQIGAVWLPLPHLLNFLPVQNDWFYRTGVSAVALSILSFALATGAIARIVLDLTESSLAAVAASAVFALNPNVLYLQATPMTEPLFLGLTLVALAMLIRWTAAAQRGQPRGHFVGCALALAVLTRYEAWLVVASALLVSVWVFWRQGRSPFESVRRVGFVALYPALVIVLFVISSRVVTGEWVTISGFFVSENKALGLPLAALSEVGWGTRVLTGPLTVAVASIGLLALLIRAIVDRRHISSLIALALLASAALPLVAFFRGHPFRIRYMIPMIPLVAIGAGAIVGVFKRSAIAALLVVAVVLSYEVRPLDSSAPMILEAQWDRPNVPVRQRVTDCLHEDYDGEKIMASMGSLGHYMQEMSQGGFAIRDFLHEGNGDIWLAALDWPKPYAGWLLIEEKAEGGDMLARIARQRPSFLEGFDRMCEGAGVVLYRRRPPIHRP
jgi:hypothetical protein